MKICANPLCPCGAVFQPDENFYYNSHSLDHLTVKCKLCQKPRVAKYTITKAKAPRKSRALAQQFQQQDGYKVCISKDCVHGGSPQLSTAFHTANNALDGLQKQCKDCTGPRSYKGKHLTASPGYRQRRDLKYKYNLTGELAELHITGGTACESCGSAENVVVDHCHELEVFRGFLCSPCNKALGMLSENPQKIAKLALYAEKCQALKFKFTPDSI